MNLRAIEDWNLNLFRMKRMTKAHSDWNSQVVMMKIFHNKMILKKKQTGK